MCLLFILAAVATSCALFLLSSGSVDSRIMAAGSVGSEELLAASVTTDKLDKEAVTTEKLNQGWVTQRVLGLSFSSAVPHSSITRDCQMCLGFCLPCFAPLLAWFAAPLLTCSRHYDNQDRRRCSVPVQARSWVRGDGTASVRGSDNGQSHRTCYHFAQTRQVCAVPVAAACDGCLCPPPPPPPPLRVGVTLHMLSYMPF